MIVLVCGSRDWNDVDYIWETLSRVLRPSDVVVHGAAYGADAIAGFCADQIGCKVIRHPADWEGLGRKAGPLRNSLMLKEEPDVVYAYHPFLPNSKGTRDMVEKAKRKGIIIHILAGRPNLD